MITEVINPYNLICNGNDSIYLSKLENKLNITLNDNSSLLLNVFELYNSNYNIEINIKAYNNTYLEINYSYITYEEINININYHIMGNNNKGNILVKSISDHNGKSNIVIDGIIDENTKNNEMDESIKIITDNDLDNVIIPNLIVNSDDVIANHSATIGQVNQDEVNYLMAKGLSKITAIRLIKNGFILSNLKINDKEKDRISEILLNRR